MTAQAPVLQTETATVGEVLSGRTVESLPLNGRNSSQLALLMPGAVTSRTRRRRRAPAVYSARPFVNGNREQTNNFLIDGIDMNETVDNRVAYQPSPDALAEISVETNNYAADIGNVAGGVISNVIKSGTNQFRGNVFEFYRNSELRREHLGQQPLRREEGRARRSTSSAPPSAARSSRTSCSSSWTTRGRSATSRAATASVAPAAWRAGDLSSLLPGHRHRPRHRAAVPEQPDPAEPDQPDRARDPERPGLPAPEPHRHGVTGNYVADAPQHHPRPPGRPPARLERLGQRQALRSASRSPSTSPRPSRRRSRCSWASSPKAPFRNLAVNWSHVFSSSLINEVLVGLQLDRQHHRLNDWGGIGNANATFGIPGGQPIAGLSAINLGSGLTTIGSRGDPRGQPAKGPTSSTRS